MGKKKDRFLEEIIGDAKKLVKQLQENCVFDGENMDEPQPQDAMPTKATDAETQQMPQQAPDGMESEMRSNADDESMDRVAQIRKVAIDGIQEYADDINNPLYDFYKRVFNECDKVMSDKVKAMNGK